MPETCKKTMARWTLLWILFGGIAHAQGIIRDPELENALRVYAAPVVESFAEKPRFYIVFDTSPNAFVRSGNAIFIHIGLWGFADTAEQMTGVIAHELGHIAGGHVADARDERRRTTQIELATTALALPLSLAAQNPALLLGIAYSGVHSSEHLYLEKNRNRELAADQSAVALLEQAGLPPYGLYSFLSKIAEYSDQDREHNLRYVRTHPVSSERLQFLEKSQSESPWKNRSPNPELERLHKRAQAKAFAFSEPPERVYAFYSDSSQHAIYARAIAQWRSGNPRRAENTLHSLLLKHPEDPFLLEFAGELARAQGHAGKAVKAYQQAASIIPWAGMVQLGLALALLDFYDADADPELLERARKALQKADITEAPSGFRYRIEARFRDRTQEFGERDLALAQNAFLIGDLARARQWTESALQTLPDGSPASQHAKDLQRKINIAKSG